MSWGMQDLSAPPSLVHDFHHQDWFIIQDGSWSTAIRLDSKQETGRMKKGENGGSPDNDNS